jgi:hypothetical protein
VMWVTAWRPGPRSDLAPGESDPGVSARRSTSISSWLSDAHSATASSSAEGTSCSAISIKPCRDR